MAHLLQPPLSTFKETLVSRPGGEVRAAAQ
ncbi:hypothetical protein E2C01_063207 [Portunus trituberculatus]|uniref:Uncharacterized protein n=1 Tax=Portunus trituberculatus TaxID=210409 RepID=A0A5B7HK65_PORTR|nr:hypothetical protein [Portunus trituberculatus]